MSARESWTKRRALAAAFLIAAVTAACFAGHLYQSWHATAAHARPAATAPPRPGTLSMATAPAIPKAAAARPTLHP
jgi:hypothetical protein